MSMDVVVFPRENFGTNPDHARNSLTNCGIRQPEYGDRRIHYMNTRKRGEAWTHDVLASQMEIEDVSFITNQIKFLTYVLPP